MSIRDDRQRMDHEYRLEAIRAHQIHMMWIYGVRLVAIFVAAVTIIAGAIMLVMGLQGSITWIISLPATFGAKLTNASPGIVFVVVGLVIILWAVAQKPVGFETGSDKTLVRIRHDFEEVSAEAKKKLRRTIVFGTVLIVLFALLGGLTGLLLARVLNF